MAKKLPIWDQRMLEVMKYCTENNLRCTEQKEWCKLIGIHETAIAQIRSLRSSFQQTHILKVCSLFNININWIFGVSDNMFLEETKEDPFHLLKWQVMKIEEMFVKMKKDFGAKNTVNITVNTSSKNRLKTG